MAKKDRILLVNCREFEKRFSNYFHNVEFINSDNYTDIFAYPCNVIVANLESESPEVIEMIDCFYEEVPYAEKLYLLKAVKGLNHKNIKCIEAIYNEDLDVIGEIYKGLSETRAFNEVVDNTRVVIRIAELVKNNPGITPDELKRKYGFKFETLDKYIEVLNAAGIFIEEYEGGLYCREDVVTDETYTEKDPNNKDKVKILLFGLKKKHIKKYMKMLSYATFEYSDDLSKIYMNRYDYIIADLRNVNNTDKENLAKYLSNDGPAMLLIKKAKEFEDIEKVRSVEEILSFNLSWEILDFGKL